MRSKIYYDQMFYKKNPSISKIKLSHSYFIKQCDCFSICIVFTFIILIDVLSHFCLIGFPIFFDDKKAAAECSYIFLDLAAKFFPFLWELKIILSIKRIQFCPIPISRQNACVLVKYAWFKHMQFIPAEIGFVNRFY